MIVIDKLEINYFRSIYSIYMSRLQDINVFIGGNDVGKSNILKALNLFFNNKSNFDEDFNFLQDLSKLREEEARSAKGRATIWIKVYFNNFSGWKSLPENFFVKRTWNRYQSRPQETYSKEIKNPTTLYRFLNKVIFHYIPAVRGRDIFSYYLSLLHDALIEDEKAGVRESSHDLMGAINESTEDMSQRILSGLGIQSNVKVPEDLRDLFKALDFSTKFSNYDIPLPMRGDGIQARHIPFILDFIARHSNKHHIWAYEEPENSLEMSRAFELAEQFREDFSEENQIFLTTHSPAFYDLEGHFVSKWQVGSEKTGPGGKQETTVYSLQEKAATDAQLGIAALVAERAKELYESIAALEDENEKLRIEIQDASKAQVIVEGPTDKLILDRALGALYYEKDWFCQFVAASGASNAAAFLQTMSKINEGVTAPIICLLDGDHAGYRELKKFNQYKHYGDTIFRQVNVETGLFFGLLPLPDEFISAANSVKKYNINDAGLPLPIEFMFPAEIVNEAIEKGKLRLKDRIIKARDEEWFLPLNLTSQLASDIPEDYLYFCREIEENSKKDFARWVVRKPDSAFENFTFLFAQLEEVCELA